MPQSEIDRAHFAGLATSDDNVPASRETMSDEDAYDCLRGSTGVSGLRLGIASTRQGDAKSELCKRARVNEIYNYAAKFMQDNTVGKRGSFVSVNGLGQLCAGTG